MGRKPKSSFSRALQRPAPSAGEISGDTFLIVVEGEGTEVEYLTGLRDRVLRRRIFEIEVFHPPATDPVRLVQAAIDTKIGRVQAAAEGMGVVYDQVWVLMDRERQHCERGGQIRVARQMAASHGVIVAVSNPCFELWLMLHYRDRPGPFRDSGHCQKELRRHIPNYKKTGLPLDELLQREQLRKAVKHGQQCEAHHASCDGDGNPSSEVHRLLRALNESVPRERRLF